MKKLIAILERLFKISQLREIKKKKKQLKKMLKKMIRFQILKKKYLMMENKNKIIKKSHKKILSLNKSKLKLKMLLKLILQKLKMTH